MKNLQDYFDAFDGNATWSELEPHFEAVMHKDLIVVTADGEYNKAQWASAVQSMLAKGAVVSGFEITHRDGDTIHYHLTIQMGETQVKPASRVQLREGMLYRVEPIAPEVYSQMARE